MEALAAAEEESSDEPYLPNHLVEKIICKVPFPYIFKARVLNKEWNSKFEGVTRSVYSTWPTYCPVFLHTLTDRSKHLLGFDGAKREWFKMNLDALPLNPPHPGPSCVVGALYCVLNWSPITCITITNLLTGKTRTIPDPPLPSSVMQNFSFAIVPLDDEKYQLVLLGIVLKLSGFVLERHIYDFKNMTWGTKSVPTAPLASRFSSRLLTKFDYLEGNMYYIGVHVGDDTPKVVQVNFEQGTATMKAIPREAWMIDHRIGRKGILRCGSRIVTFVISFQISPHGKSFVREIAHLYEVNTQTLELVKLSESAVRFHVSHRGDPMIVATINSIHFCGLSGHLSYNLESNTWRTHSDTWNFGAVYANGRESLSNFSFQPGLNPFMVP